MKTLDFLSATLRFYGVTKVDGILADFGVSSHQFDTPERGFSIRFEGDLDMRMDDRQAQSAAEMINDGTHEELADILFHFGELRNAKAIASHIIKSREEQPIKTTTQLNSVLQPF